MKDKNRIAIGIVVLGLLMPLIAIGAWKLEMNRGSCSEARAKEAMENGDWELAAAYAEKADIEELRLETAHKVAEQAFENGEYERAREAFALLGTYRDAQERVKACLYASADALERAGENEAARDAFFALIPYADSSDRFRACGYRAAEQYLSDGKSQKAFQMFMDLIPYADSEARAVEIAVLLTGETDPEKAMLFARGYSEADWNRLEQMSDARSSLTNGRIAVGKAHAVFLYADGHVEAAGDDSFGQCGVSSFRDVKAVAAGYRHTLGLKSDGTVIATGDDSYGQCDVGSWTDVVSIACGAWDSFGIRSDGSLLHCGFSAYDLDGWTDLRFVDACETALIGVCRDGTLLCTNAVGRYPGGSYCDACITNGAAFALSEEGTLRSADDETASWTDMVGIVSSASVLIGIRSDGTLSVHALVPLNESYAAALSEETNAVEVAPAGMFALVLHRDGTVAGCGTVPPSIAAYLCQMPPL